MPDYQVISIASDLKIQSSPSFPYGANGSLAFGPAEAPGWAERSKAASNPELTIDELWDFARDSHYFVRVAVAKNRCTPKEILAHLAVDPNRLVRGSVPFNPNVPSESLAALGEDSDAWVRQNAKENTRYYRVRMSEVSIDIAA
jgi:hypothetical protein